MHYRLQSHSKGPLSWNKELNAVLEQGAEHYPETRLTIIYTIHTGAHNPGYGLLLHTNSKQHSILRCEGAQDDTLLS